MTSYWVVSLRDLTKEMAPQPEPSTTTFLRRCRGGGNLGDGGGGRRVGDGRAGGTATRRTGLTRVRSLRRAPERATRAGSRGGAHAADIIAALAVDGVEITSPRTARRVGTLGNVSGGAATKARDWGGVARSRRGATGSAPS